jgi:hypothetical protein
MLGALELPIARLDELFTDRSFDVIRQFAGREPTGIETELRSLRTPEHDLDWGLISVAVPDLALPICMMGASRRALLSSETKRIWLAQLHSEGFAKAHPPLRRMIADCLVTAMVSGGRLTREELSKLAAGIELAAADSWDSDERFRSLVLFRIAGVAGIGARIRDAVLSARADAVVLSARLETVLMVPPKGKLLAEVKFFARKLVKERALVASVLRVIAAADHAKADAAEIFALAAQLEEQTAN